MDKNLYDKDEYRVMEPGKDGWTYASAIGRFRDGSLEDWQFIRLSESEWYGKSTDSNRTKVLDFLKDKYFGRYAKRRASVDIRDVQFHEDWNHFGQLYVNCLLDGVRQKDVPVTPLVAEAWRGAAPEELGKVAEKIARNAYFHQIDSTIFGSRQLFVRGQVHQAQLEALLDKCGYKLEPDAFDGLDINEDGYVTNASFLISNDYVKKWDNSEEERPVISLQKLLGKARITGAEVTDINPETGERMRNRTCFVSCEIDGVRQQPVHVGSRLFDSYVQGRLTEHDLASGIYYDTMLQAEKVQRIETDCGYRTVEGSRVVYHGDYNGEGTVYKDMKAFDNKKGVCYIGEHELVNYRMLVEDGEPQEAAERYGVTYTDLMEPAIQRGFRNPEEKARYCLLSSEWEHPLTRMNEMTEAAEEEDFLPVKEATEAKYVWYVKNKGSEPLFADVLVHDRQTDKEEWRTVALDKWAGKAAQKEVLLIAEGSRGLMEMMDKGYKGRYHIKDMEQFLAGSRTLREERELFIDAERRLSDVTLYHDKNGKPFVRCKVDGIQMSGKPAKGLEPGQKVSADDVLMEAARAFRDEMYQQTQEKRGLTR